MTHSTLVTGATGFLGSELVSQLIRGGDSVIAFVRDLEKARHSLPESVSLVDDISQLATVPDRLVNLAGSPISCRWTRRAIERIEASRIGLTERLVDHFIKLGAAPQVVLSGSAIGWYGFDVDRRGDEKGVVGAGYAASLCDRWEKAARPFMEQFGSRLVHLRTGLVLDQGGGLLEPLLPLYKMGIGGPVGSGRQWIPWIHRQDYTAILGQLLATDHFSGPINLVAPNPVRQREFAETLARCLHRPHVVRTPAFALRLLYGSMAEELLLGGAQVVSERMAELDYRFSYPHLRDALSDIFDTQSPA